MKWWKQKSTKVLQAKQKVAGKLVLFVDNMKKQCAGWLDKKINPLPVAKKRLLLFAFCILTALYCFLLLLSPFRVVKNDAAVTIDPMPFPQQPLKEIKPRKEVFIGSEQYNRIHAFKLYLDSLAKDTTGQQLFDSIVVRHPGIMDSLQKIEDYYQLQK